MAIFADAREKANYVNNRAAYLYTFARCVGVINRRPRILGEATVINTNSRYTACSRNATLWRKGTEGRERERESNGSRGVVCTVLRRTRIQRHSK